MSGLDTNTFSYAAICDNITCQNGGNCTSPNNCTCPEGQWEGDSCEIGRELIIIIIECHHNTLSYASYM